MNKKNRHKTKLECLCYPLFFFKVSLESSFQQSDTNVHATRVLLRGDGHPVDQSFPHGSLGYALGLHNVESWQIKVLVLGLVSE